MYKVLRKFADLKDNNHIYHQGDAFPREGGEADEERIAELSGSENKIGQPLIEKVEEKPKRKRSK